MSQSLVLHALDPPLKAGEIDALQEMFTLLHLVEQSSFLIPIANMLHIPMEIQVVFKLPAILYQL